VALKLLHAHLQDHQLIRKRFMYEAGLARKRHGKTRYLLEARDSGTDPQTGVPYIVMELLRGRALNALLSDLGARGELLPIAEAVRYFMQVCEAIAVMHAESIIHRDIKPANVFLVDGEGGEDYVKVIDFGIAWDVRTRRLTPAGSFVGVPGLMAPEELALQFASGAKSSRHTPSARDDVWKLGYLGYRLCAGRRPFPGTTEVELQLGAYSTRPSPIERPDMPPWLWYILATCLSYSPEARYAHAGALLEALRSFTAENGAAASSRPLPGGSLPGPVGDDEDLTPL
jgi:serine/threonine-protein kinase